MLRQLKLGLKFKGGKREGAGRPRTLPHPGLGGPGVPHLRREGFQALLAVHVTLRLRPGVVYLRKDAAVQVLLQSFKEAADRFGMRIAHYSIQGNHLHLVVEAKGAQSLSRGVQGLAIRIARRLNRRLRRSGKVFADRFHSHVLRSRREVANTVRYVLNNYRHHARKRLPPHWRDPLAKALETPRLWLLREGWCLEPARMVEVFEPP